MPDFYSVEGELREVRQKYDTGLQFLFQRKFLNFDEDLTSKPSAYSADVHQIMIIF